MKSFCSLVVLYLLNILNVNAQLGEPILNTPSDNATQQKLALPIVWNKVTGATSYQYQVDTATSFSSKWLKQDTITGNFDTIRYLLPYNKKYYWRVRAFDATQTSNWSSIRNFTTTMLVAVQTGNPQPISGNLQLYGTGVNMRMQIDTSANYNSKILYDTLIRDDGKFYIYALTPVLYFNKKYNVRVRLEKGNYKSEWGYTNSFTTTGNPLAGYAPINNFTLNSNFDLTFQLKKLFENPKQDTIYNEIQVDTSSDFNTTMLKKIYCDVNIYKANSDFLLQNQKYYWRYKVVSAIDTTQWSAVYSFKTFIRAGLIYPNTTNYNDADSIGKVNFNLNKEVSYVKFEIDTLSTFNSHWLISDTINSSGKTNYSKYFKPYYYKKSQYIRYKVFAKADSTNWLAYPIQFNKTVSLVSPNNGDFFYDVNPTFKWSKIGNTKYEVQVDTTTNFNSYLLIRFFKDSSALISDDLYYGKRQYWRVRALNKTDSSLWSAYRYFDTRAKITLSQPKNKDTAILSSYQLQANPILGTDYYEIRLSSDSTFATFQYVKLADKPGYIVYTPLTNFTVLSGKTYFWYVIGTHKRDTVYSDVWKFRMKNTDPTPSKVTLVSPTNNYKDLPYTLYDITFDWLDNANTTQYEMQYATSSDFTQNLITNTTTLSEIKLHDFSAGTSYFWRVRSKNLTKTGPWSDVWTFSMIGPLTVPIQLSPDNKSNIPINVTLNWEDIQNAKSYDYRYGNNITFTTEPVFNTSVSEAKLSNLLTNKTYYWGVRSKNQYYVTSWGYTATFTTGTLIGVDKTAQIKLVVYPNPVQENEFIISGENLPSSNIQLYDLKGSKIELNVHSLADNKIKLMTKHKIYGVYILLVQNSFGTDRVKLVFE